MNAPERAGRFRRADVRARTQRELSRYRAREPNTGFWRALSLIGSVGWPIVLLSLAGTFLGRLCDGWLDSGIRCTAVLLFVGAGLGTWTALRSVKKGAT